MLGIGVTAPTAKVHIKSGASDKPFRLEDGSEGDGKVLTVQDAQGHVKWESVNPNVVFVWRGNNNNFPVHNSDTPNTYFFFAGDKQGTNDDYTFETYNLETLSAADRAMVTADHEGFTVPVGTYLCFLNGDLYDYNSGDPYFESQAAPVGMTKQEVMGEEYISTFLHVSWIGSSSPFFRQQFNQEHYLSGIVTVDVPAGRAPAKLKLYHIWTNWGLQFMQVVPAFENMPAGHIMYRKAWYKMVLIKIR